MVFYSSSPRWPALVGSIEWFRGLNKMKFPDLYKSLFAILRIENISAKVVGTGFVINTNPFYILTCNHVVGEGNDSNKGTVQYAITKRTDSFEEFDLRRGEISFFKAKQIFYKPELDLAILKVDLASDPDMAAKLNIKNPKSLKLSFNQAHREPGSGVEWLSTAASGDLTLTPRFFKGQLITKYVTDHKYEFINSQKITTEQVMTGIDMMEIDKLFIPGSSGSPILNSSSGRVIGYVHGFRSWPIVTNNELKQKVEIIENSNSKNVELKYNIPLVTSLSLGIDIRAAETYLKDEKFIKKQNILRKKLSVFYS